MFWKQETGPQQLIVGYFTGILPLGAVHQVISDCHQRGLHGDPTVLLDLGDGASQILPLDGATARTRGGGPLGRRNRRQRAPPRGRRGLLLVAALGERRRGSEFSSVPAQLPFSAQPILGSRAANFAACLPVRVRQFRDLFPRGSGSPARFARYLVARDGCVMVGFGNRETSSPRAAGQTAGVAHNVANFTLYQTRAVIG
jgi:hypothetical protein